MHKYPSVMQPPGARSQSAGLKVVLVSDQLKMLFLNRDPKGKVFNKFTPQGRVLQAEGEIIKDFLSLTI